MRIPKNSLLTFIYSEKATKFCKISTLLLSYVVPVKSEVEILQNIVAFSEYMNIKIRLSPLKTLLHPHFAKSGRNKKKFMNFEFKFDDTRLSSYYKNKSGIIKFEFKTISIS